ncbi:MAG: hexapeptide transferase [Bacteroidia bacterium]|nr:hexapeptide transferase [Bacteroidia bacterium]
MIKRILYLAYYFKELDKSKLNKFLTFASNTTKKSKASIWLDMVRSSITYNISLLEYFNFRFYEISEKEKLTYAGTGYMYEFQLKMNPKETRSVLEDKLTFLKEYGTFVKHSFASLNDLQKDKKTGDRMLSNTSGKIVLKDSRGQCGNGIEVRKSNELNADTLVARLLETSNDFVEEFVVQHSKLMELSPSGLNTIRIITQINKKNEVDILGCRLRITINSPIDNMAAGNIAAPIDEISGKVTGPGVYSDITKKDEYFHPVTGIEIVGFEVPFWPETIKMIKQAALKNVSNKSIGWDIAITNNGAELIEGNHDWCKLLWQLPVKKGLKPVLESYLKA